MDRQNNTKALVESSILTVIAIVLMLMNIYLPAFFVIGFFIWPIPITLIYVKHGIKFSILSFIITYIITALSFEPVSVFGIMVIFGLVAIVLGYCIKSEKPATISIFIMAGAEFLFIIIIFEIFQLVIGQDIISSGIKSVIQSYATAKSMYLQLGMSKASVNKMMASLPTEAMMKMVLPASFIIISIVIVFLLYLFTQIILKRLKYNISEIKPLSEWYIPSKVSFGIILIFGISALLMLMGIKNGENYYINANIIFISAFTVNALAFVSAFLKKRKVAKVIRWIVIILCILLPINNFIYFLGIFDYMLDFRKLDKARKRPIE